MTEENVQGTIHGALQLREGELGVASVEAVGPERIRLGLVAFALGLALVGVGWNAIEGARPFAWMTAVFSVLLMLVSLETTRRQRSSKLRVTRERLAQTGLADGGYAVRYALDASGLTIMRHDASVSLAWRGCHGYEEAGHTFQLYFDRQLPELVFKRAFEPQDLQAVRALLARCIPERAVGRRAMRRVVGVSMAMGVLILALGVGLALVVRH